MKKILLYFLMLIIILRVESETFTEDDIKEMDGYTQIDTNCPRSSNCIQREVGLYDEEHYSKVPCGMGGFIRYSVDLKHHKTNVCVKIIGTQIKRYIYYESMPDYDDLTSTPTTGDFGLLQGSFDKMKDCLNTIRAKSSISKWRFLVSALKKTYIATEWWGDYESVVGLVIYNLIASSNKYVSTGSTNRKFSSWDVPEMKQVLNIMKSKTGHGSCDTFRFVLKSITLAKDYSLMYKKRIRQMFIQGISQIASGTEGIAGPIATMISSSLNVVSLLMTDFENKQKTRNTILQQIFEPISILFEEDKTNCDDEFHKAINYLNNIIFHTEDDVLLERCAPPSTLFSNKAQRFLMAINQLGAITKIPEVEGPENTELEGLGDAMKGLTNNHGDS